MPSERRLKKGFVFHFARRVPTTSASWMPYPSPHSPAPCSTWRRSSTEAPARLLERAEELEDDTGRKLFNLRDFESLLGRTSGHPGHMPLTEALRLYRPELAVLRSNLERDFRDLVRASSLPLPSQNVFVDRYELDCYWEPERPLRRTRRLRDPRLAPLLRDRSRTRGRPAAAGIEVMRVTDVRLEREAQAEIERLRQHLERRRRTLALD